MSYKLYASASVLVPLITETYKKSKFESPINKTMYFHSTELNVAAVTENVNTFLLV